MRSRAEPANLQSLRAGFARPRWHGVEGTGNEPWGPQRLCSLSVALALCPALFLLVDVALCFSSNEGQEMTNRSYTDWFNLGSAAIAFFGAIIGASMAYGLGRAETADLARRVERLERQRASGNAAPDPRAVECAKLASKAAEADVVAVLSVERAMQSLGCHSM